MAQALKEWLKLSPADVFDLMDKYRSDPDPRELASFQEDGRSVDTLELDLLRANLDRMGVDVFRLCAQMGLDPRREEVCVIAHHAIGIANNKGATTPDNSPKPKRKKTTDPKEVCVTIPSVPRYLT